MRDHWQVMKVLFASGLLAGLLAFAARGQSPPVIVKELQGMIVAPGTTVTLHIEVTGDPPITYRWRRDLVTMRGETNSTLVLTNVTEGALYTVVITNQYGVNLGRNGYVTLFSVSQGEDGVGLNLDGVVGPGWVYELQAVNEAGATNWTTVTNLTLTHRPYRWVDPAATNTTQRFYRAVLVETPLGPVR